MDAEGCPPEEFRQQEYVSHMAGLVEIDGPVSSPYQLKGESQVEKRQAASFESPQSEVGKLLPQDLFKYRVHGQGDIRIERCVAVA